MPTSYEQFQLLPFEQQVALVWVEGVFLAVRQEEENKVDLYYMDGGFFSEVHCNKNNHILYIQCFTSSETLAKYPPSH